MADVAVLNAKRQEVARLTLPDAVYGREFNRHLLYESVRAYLASARAGTHATKNRVDVSGRTVYGLRWDDAEHYLERRDDVLQRVHFLTNEAEPAYDYAALEEALKKHEDFDEGAARNLEPHRITYFLTELAAQLHSYYYKHRFISDDAGLTQARFWLVGSIKTVLAHGLGILGVEAPETM